MVVELNFINIVLILLAAKLIGVLSSKLAAWSIEKFLPQYIKKCSDCGSKYFETSNYCEYCGKELKYLKDNEESEVIDVEEDD